MMNAAQRRKELLKTLREQVKRNKKSPLTVAVIGTPGVGKSSFVNTMITSITGEYMPWTTTGRGGEQITLRPVWIYHTNYMAFAEERFKQDAFPDIVDLVGFEDCDDEITRKLIELLFYGRIPSNVLLHEVFSEIRQYGPWFVDQKYPLTTESKKVDRVIFVASAANSNLPQGLCSAVRTVISKKRDIPIFGVLTGRDKRSSAMENFNQFEEKFKSALGISNLNYLNCTNYCDANINEIRVMAVRHYPDLDIPILEFLNQVLNPALECTDIARHVSVTWAWMWECLITLPSKSKGVSKSHWILITIVISLIVVILAILFNGK